MASHTNIENQAYEGQSGFVVSNNSTSREIKEKSNFTHQNIQQAEIASSNGVSHTKSLGIKTLQLRNLSP